MRRRRLSAGSGESGGHDSGGSLRWLLTYADMITLLMAFFIILYSVSVLNLNRFRELAVSVRSGFDAVGDGRGRSILLAGDHFDMKPSPFEGENAGVPWQALKELQKLVREAHLDKAVSLRQDERGVVVSMVTDKALFPKAQAELTEESKKTLDLVADLIKKVPNHAMVEGHTCDLPIVSQKYPSNWELSTARAAAVVRYFIEEKGIPADRLSAAGYASSKPLPNTEGPRRELNRRVDVVILKLPNSEIER